MGETARSIDMGWSIWAGTYDGGTAGGWRRRGKDSARGRQRLWLRKQPRRRKASIDGTSRGCSGTLRCLRQGEGSTKETLKRFETRCRLRSSLCSLNVGVVVVPVVVADASTAIDWSTGSLDRACQAAVLLGEGREGFPKILLPFFTSVSATTIRHSH
jgi:hypothetical protein